MDYYTFRREFDFATNFPEMIVQLKKNRHIRKMDLAEKKELYDNIYAIAKEYFLLSHVLREKKLNIDNAAIDQIIDRGPVEWEKMMQLSGHNIQQQ